MKKLTTIVGFMAVLASALFAVRCSTTGGAVQLDVSAPPFEHLSEYKFFTGLQADLTPNDGVLPYDLITPLFTDYAHKARFVWMPDGSMAQYDPEETLDFPVGAVLIKNFYYHNDDRDPALGKRVIETRLLVRREAKWDALTYIWDQDQKDAVLEVAGDVKRVAWTDGSGETREINYVIPDKNQCKGCHEYNGVITPIGPKVRNLNMDFPYASGAANQLDKWASVGYLEGYDKAAPHGKVADWDDPETGSLQDRALAYLEINCGHCHRKGGPAGISGLNLVTTETNIFNLGICKTPVSAGSGSGGNTYDIVPGHPERSILLYRMTIDNPGERMPELGRSIMHLEGVTLIKDWIASLEGECPESMDQN